MSEKPTIGEQNYQTFADRYAARVPTKPHNAYYNFPAVVSLLPDVAELHVLDAGCGSGMFTTWLLEQGAEVVAFDVTPRMVELVREQVGDAATVLRHDLARPLDFAQDNTFDLVVCSLVLDYIEDWSAVFREFERVLKPGGMVVFSCGHPHGDYDWLNYKEGKTINYFAVEQHEVHWGGFGEPRPLIKFYRRPLNAMINPLLQAGLLLDHLLEPLPGDDFKRDDPQRYEELMRLPGFICIRARKP